jgi:acyl-CoA synthetase (AMP-forming)/AMP-acid ligase II
MLGTLVLDPPDHVMHDAIVTSGATVAWFQLARVAQRLAEPCAPLAGRRVGVSFRRVPEAFALLAALDRLGCDVFLLREDLDPVEASDLGKVFRLGALVKPVDGSDSVKISSLSDEAPGSATSSVTILTSGTSGPPKAVRHTWETLARPTRRSSAYRGTRWLLAYRPELYAGLQVILQCFLNTGTLVVPRNDADAEEIARLMAEAEVQYVSATPSYWRQLILFGSEQILSRVPIRQVTLGGEVVDQAILDALRRLYPEARLVHIYATTELGRCFSVTDGRAGFPARFLEEPQPDDVHLAIRDRELLIRSGNAMLGYDPLSAGDTSAGDWHATGDLVEFRDDRVLFVGRRTDVINVGGNKVHPLEIERLVRTVAGVADVRVFGKASSVAGQLVACEVVPSRSTGTEGLRRAIQELSLSALRPHQRPRLIRFVDRIGMSTAGKTSRRSQ